MMSLSVAITTFVGQNLGAGNYERARSGAKSGLVIGLIIMAVVLVPLYIFAPQIVTLFNKEAEVVEFGGLFIRIVAPFYLMFAINQVYSGALRGAGDFKRSAPSSFSVVVPLLCFFRGGRRRGGGGAGSGGGGGALQTSLLKYCWGRY